MYTLRENLDPLMKRYERWINGFYLSGLLRYKGQQQIGSDYISKVFKAKSYEIMSRFENAVRTVQDPTYMGFLYDNFFRIFALNGVQRLITAYQAAPGLQRFSRPNSLGFLLTEIMNDGALRGTFRGVSFNFLQSSLVLWPSILLTNKSKGGLLEFIGAYSVLDAVLYPLDTVKVKAYANTEIPISVKQALFQCKLSSLYSGILLKILFNIPFAGALYTTATANPLAWAFWAATLFLYPLNTLKAQRQASPIRPQTLNFSFPVSSLYRGVVPFALVNLLAVWQCTALFGEERLKLLFGECAEESIQRNGYY